MISRYSLPPMTELWSEQAKYERWLQVELAVLQAQEKLGRLPAGVFADVRCKARLDLERINAIEAEIKHDVLSFIRALEEILGESGRWLHLGLTASDVVDSANALAMRDAFTLILEELDALLQAVKTLAFEHKTTLMVGRTHGVHAEPLTFGLKLLNWYAQLERDHERLTAAKQVVSVGKISGSVGTYANVEPEVERQACEILGLTPAKISNQILQRDRHAQALSALAILGTAIERISVECRHLSRTEVSEIYELDAHRSSSMPHKKNPIRAETLSGLSRVLRSNLQAELESVALWHERDISNSSVERIVLPDSFTLAHYMVVGARKMIEALQPDVEQMAKNLKLTQGLIYSQAVLLALVTKGMPRAQAHEHVRELTGQVDKNTPLMTLLLQDELVAQYLSKEDVEASFSADYSLKHVETVFKRFE